MTKNNVISDYFKLLDEVYKYFDFKEDWVIYPIEDYRGYYWYIDYENNDYGEAVIYSKNSDILNSDYYSSEIHHQRFYEKYIYRGEDYTLIIIDTHTDGNKFFAIFENSFERTDCVSRIGNSKKVEKLLHENEQLKAIINEAIDYIKKGYLVSTKDLLRILEKGGKDEHR